MAADFGHSPQGECGLKFDIPRVFVNVVWSLPARGVWIEIYSPTYCQARAGHSPQGECGLKFLTPPGITHAKESLPARGVWIEMFHRRNGMRARGVTPRKGSVD